MRARRALPAVAAGVLMCGAALPQGTSAQEGAKIPRVAILAGRKRPESFESDYYGGLPQGFRDLGYVEGKNLTLEWRFADGDSARLPALAADLVSFGPDVIVADGTPETLALQKVTTAIPIVFCTAGDPVGNGLVRSLARPGGNATGLSSYTGDSTEAVKQLEMIRAIVPGLTRIGVLCNHTNPYTPLGLKTLQDAAATQNVTLVPVETRNAEEIGRAFETMKKERIRAFLLIRNGLFFQQRLQMIALSSRYRLPYVAGLRETAEAGALISYGLDIRQNWRRAAAYVDKILKGAKAGDLPVELPMKFELVINRKTAKSLGLTIPPELLLLADRVIE